MREESLARLCNLIVQHQPLDGGNPDLTTLLAWKLNLEAKVPQMPDPVDPRWQSFFLANVPQLGMLDAQTRAGFLAALRDHENKEALRIGKKTLDDIYAKQTAKFMEKERATAAVLAAIKTDIDAKAAAQDVKESVVKIKDEETVGDAIGNTGNKDEKVSGKESEKSVQVAAPVKSDDKPAKKKSGLTGAMVKAWLAEEK